MRKTLLGMLALSTASMAGAVTVFNDDFEAGPPGSAWGGAGSIQSTAGLSAYGFGALHLRNDSAAATTLALTGLTPHTEVTLSLDLAMWDSIDLGDRFAIAANSTTLFSASGENPAFGNYFPPEPGPGAGPGVKITPDLNGFTTSQLGYNTGLRDSARSASYTFAHSGSTLLISWQYGNSQGGLDESFGLDNVVVMTNAVPEPSTYLMMALGPGLIGGIAARRRG